MEEAKSNTAKRVTKKEKRLAALELARARNKRARRSTEALTDIALKRLAHRAGIKRLMRGVFAEMRLAIHSFVDDISKDAVLMADCAKRRTISASDFLRSLRRRGRPVYGIRHGV